ncbi:MAG TPA: pentapeptide repeat-containing protein, partial [Pseudonocardia sp.]|nr:pentapeptide repeat-containing protein [Pseudonocardia sp.]
ETAAARERTRNDRVLEATTRRREAEQRRDTDLYAQAVGQLGSGSPAVRMGGLYALERLGQDSPTQRQLVIDMLCAYLRTPAEPGGEPPDRQEREVRLTAQRILHRHLRPGGDGHRQADRYWPGTDLDLTGAWLDDFALGGCEVGSARFDRAHFEGPAHLERTRFHGLATFDGAHFTDEAMFDHAAFDAQVRFRSAAVDGTAWFGQAAFGGDALFERCRFGAAQFEKARFTGTADFSGSEFAGPAGFRRAWFGVSALFDGARFGDAATFDHSRFDGDVRFGRTQFANPAEFTGARADDWGPAQPSSWPAGWTTHESDDPSRVAVVEEPGEPAAGRTREVPVAPPEQRGPVEDGPGPDDADVGGRGRDPGPGRRRGTGERRREPAGRAGSCRRRLERHLRPLRPTRPAGCGEAPARRSVRPTHPWRALRAGTPTG